MIDWQTQLNSLNKNQIADHMEIDGNPPLTGADAPLGYFVGKSIDECGFAPCSLQAWVEDNTPFAIDLVYRFEARNSKATIEIYWKDQLDQNGDYLLAKSFGPFVVTGRSSMTGAFAGQHELMGAEMFKKFAQWCFNIINGG